MPGRKFAPPPSFRSARDFRLKSCLYTHGDRGSSVLRADFSHAPLRCAESYSPHFAREQYFQVSCFSPPLHPSPSPQVQGMIDLEYVLALIPRLLDERPRFSEGTCAPPFSARSLRCASPGQLTKISSLRWLLIDSANFTCGFLCLVWDTTRPFSFFYY